MSLSDAARKLMDRWIVGDFYSPHPEDAEPEPKSEAEEWYEYNQADAEGDEKWIQEREEREKAPK